jgi:tryptophan synthase alpha chain
MRAVTDLPLAVGFGVSRPEHVAELGRQVEAVAVGSAIVDLIHRHRDNPSLEIHLEAFVRELKQGFDTPAAEAQ